MIIPKGCNFHVRPPGIIHILFHILLIFFTLIVLWVDSLSKTGNVFHFKP